MTEEIGTVAGAIWKALNDKGELTLTNLKKEVGRETPICEFAIGWLAREDKVVVERDKRTLRISLKETRTQAANAA
jgi:hypothetical protein